MSNQSQLPPIIWFFPKLLVESLIHPKAVLLGGTWPSVGRWETGCLFRRQSWRVPVLESIVFCLMNGCVWITVSKFLCLCRGTNEPAVKLQHSPTIQKMSIKMDQFEVIIRCVWIRKWRSCAKHTGKQRRCREKYKIGSSNTYSQTILLLRVRVRVATWRATPYDDWWDAGNGYMQMLLLSLYGG